MTDLYCARDMLDKASVGHALQQQFSWHTFEGVLLADRKAYDQACEKYDEWEEKQHQLKLEAAAAAEYQARSMSSPGLALMSADVAAGDASQIARSQSSPQPSTGSPTLAPSLLTIMPGDASPPRASGKRVPDTATAASYFGEAASSISASSYHVPPTEMLSRTMRVFIAWKAS